MRAAEPNVLVLGSGRAGHEANALGVAEALGWPYRLVRPSPSPVLSALAPYGPAGSSDFRRIAEAGEPSLVIACGRQTVPYARAFKRERRSKAFVVFLQDPRASRRAFDLIWAPQHDGLKGDNVLSTLTSPHPISPARLAALRAAPDPRLAALPAPRAALVLGGPSRDVAYAEEDVFRLGQAASALGEQGFSVMATPSRRTTPAMHEAVRAALSARNSFFWDMSGENPYAAMLALADVVAVTADSANMLGEAAATGRAVYAIRPGGRLGRIDAMIEGLKARGALREFDGAVERFSYEPIDSSAVIAGEIRRRMADRGLA